MVLHIQFIDIYMRHQASDIYAADCIIICFSRKYICLLMVPYHFYGQDKAIQHGQPNLSAVR